MTESLSETDANQPLIDLPAREIFERVADPKVNAGGGVIAGLTLAGAAASAELVIRLAARRKSLADRRPEIEALLKAINQHRQLFEQSPDNDMEAFSSLVEVQRQAKQVRQSDPLQSESMLLDAYVRAADVPLELSRQGLVFLSEVEQGLEFASKFTISDLGAAAVLARGAIDAALLTVDANLAYVSDGRGDSVRAELLRIRGNVWETAERILNLATNVITNEGNGG